MFGLTANSKTNDNLVSDDSDNLQDHVVTEEDIEENPELENEGIKVGDTIQILETEEDEKYNNNFNQEQSEEENFEDNSRTQDGSSEEHRQEDSKKIEEVTTNSSDKELKYEGKVIKEILNNDPLETETLYHVRFVDGTTGHVPKDFLDNELGE